MGLRIFFGRGSEPITLGFKIVILLVQNIEPFLIVAAKTKETRHPLPSAPLETGNTPTGLFEPFFEGEEVFTGMVRIVPHRLGRCRTRVFERHRISKREGVSKKKEVSPPQDG
jgi:hypothetical protein